MDYGGAHYWSSIRAHGLWSHWRIQDTKTGGICSNLGVHFTNL